MSLSAKEAAEQVGMSKQGILKAVKQGKLSAQKDHNGEWRIDPVELFRVYSPVNHGLHQLEPTSSQQHTPENTLGVNSLQREIELLREQIELLKDERDDLRSRLDTEAEERRRLTLLLTDHRSSTTTTPNQLDEPVSQAKPKGFWRRLFG